LFNSYKLIFYKSDLLNIWCASLAENESNWK